MQTLAYNCYQVANALEELNKRIYEHDKNITLGGVKEEVTLKVISIWSN